jgi:hypothetical protein
MIHPVTVKDTLIIIISVFNPLTFHQTAGTGMLPDNTGVHGNPSCAINLVVGSEIEKLVTTKRK